MGLFGIFKRKPQSVLEALEADPTFQDLKKLNDLLVLQCEMRNGVDADEVPNGSGEFGLSPTNPIPCKTTFGSTAYLGRLRAPDDTKVTYTRIGSMNHNLEPGPTDAYDVFHRDGRKLATIYICPYHKRISGKAPRGLTLATHSFA